MAQDPYRLLGVPRTAGQDEIKAAFRRLAKQNHPDLNPSADAEAAFRAGAAAYELLCDPARRARFDRGDIDAEGKPCPRPAEPEPPDIHEHTKNWREQTGYRQSSYHYRAEHRAFDMGAPRVPKRAAGFGNWGAAAIIALLMAIILASQYDHSWRGRFGQAEFGIVLVLFLIRWSAAGFRSLDVDGATQGCFALAFLLSGAALWDFLDRGLNGRFARAGYPPFFGDFVGLVCLVTSILLCLPSGRRAALAGFAAFLLAGGILGVMQGQAAQVHVTVVMLPICVGLLLACEARAAGGR